MSFVIQIISNADGMPCNISNCYLKTFDPEGGGGQGIIEVTRLKKQAMKFNTQQECFEVWQKQSKTLPLRPDGKPNKPLTAFNISFVPLET